MADTFCSDACSASIAELFSPLTNIKTFEVTPSLTSYSLPVIRFLKTNVDREGLKLKANLTKYLDNATTVHPGYYCLLDHPTMMAISMQPSTLEQDQVKRTQRIVVDCLQMVWRIIRLQSHDSNCYIYRSSMTPFKSVPRVYAQRL